VKKEESRRAQFTLIERRRREKRRDTERREIKGWMVRR